MLLSPNILQNISQQPIVTLLQYCSSIAPRVLTLKFKIEDSCEEILLEGPSGQVTSPRSLFQCLQETLP